MKSFLEYSLEQDYTDGLIKLALVLEYEDLLDDIEFIEDLSESFGDILGGDGLIGYITRFGSAAGKLVLAAIKGNKSEVKSIASKLDKGDVIDFFLKLDQATMHILTGPIHVIDAITGWEIMHEIRGLATKGNKQLKKVKAAYAKLKAAARTTFKNRPDAIKAIDNLEPLIGPLQ